MRCSATTALGLVAVLLVGGCSGDDGAASGSANGSDDRPATSTTSAAPATTAPIPPAPDRPVVIAHRGASGHAPEHTFASYDLARAQGADYLEQDLQMTADGELVVLHDETLDRTARGPAESCAGPVADKTLEQLRQCDVGSWFNEAHPDRADPAFVGLRIPTLREVFERYGTDVRYYIETKSPEAQPGMEEALLDLLDEFGLSSRGSAAARQVLIQSFSAASLRLVHELRPELPLVLLIGASGGPVDPAVLDEVAGYAIGVGPTAGLADAAFVEAAHARCLVVHPYTVDDPAFMATLLDAGVDGMFTNEPDQLVAAVVGRPVPTPAEGCGASPPPAA